VRQHLADYYACIEFLDAQVGRIIDALKTTGQLENTIIVFTSDHGLAIGSHGLFGKQNLYEHSMRSPLIIAGPGIAKNKQTEAMCYLLDIYPTLGALANVPAPPGSEGRSLLPVILGTSATHRDVIFTAYIDSQRAVRDDRWKLIVYPQINKKQLFDLQNDPDELHDLSADPNHAKELERLIKLLREQQAGADDHQALTTEKPLPAEFDFSRIQSR
jgi:arylsulfatase A-like enzyme